jgi:NADH-quinone oxidoreductase subunit J
VLTPQPEVSVNQIGIALMHRFVLPLEVTGLLLTAALIGAGILAMDEKGGAR